jgi:hypothetical protein
MNIQANVGRIGWAEFSSKFTNLRTEIYYCTVLMNSMGLAIACVFETVVYLQIVK